jgi:peptide/nickel transport system substrate-binding protein
MRMHALRLAAAIVALGLALAAPSIAQETPRMGGVLKVAAIGEPPTLDIPSSTATLV